MGNKRCSALRASHEPGQKVDTVELSRSGDGLFLVELLNSLPQFQANDRFVLTVNDNGIFVCPLPPFLIPVFPYVVADLADVDGVVDDRFDRDAAKGVSWFGLVAFGVQLVCDASKALAATVHPEDFPYKLCLDVIDPQDGVLTATAFHLDYVVTEDRAAIPLSLSSPLFHAHLDVFHDGIPLEFGDYAKHLDVEFAGGCLCVEVFLRVAAELDVIAVQVLDDLEQVRHLTTDPVQLPNLLNFAFLYVTKQLLHCRTLLDRFSRDARVDVLLEDDFLLGLAKITKGRNLSLDAVTLFSLFLSTDASVYADVFHFIFVKIVSFFHSVSIPF